MKFRLDFVTNSSSSSYIAITIKSADLCKVISHYQLLDLNGQPIRCWNNDTLMFDSQPDRYDLYDAVPFSQQGLPDTILHWLNELFIKVSPEAQAVIKASIKNAEYVEMISNFEGEDTPSDNLYSRGVLDHGDYNHESNRRTPFQPSYRGISGCSEIIRQLAGPLPEAKPRQAVEQNDLLRKNWEYELDSALGHTITITKYKGNDTKVVIPAEIDGYQVQRLEGAALSFGGHIHHHLCVFPGERGHNNIREIVVHEGVAIIGDNSFSDCTCLESVILPTTLREIGKQAFYSCGVLESLALPLELSMIGEQAFCFCSSLKSLHLPDSVTSIGDFAFYGCESLKEINIPPNLQFIGDSAFSSCSKLFPEKRFLIINGVLFDIRSDESCIALPDGIRSLSAASIPDTVKELCIPDTCTSLPNPTNQRRGSLSDKRNLEKVLLPEGIESIDASLFAGDTALKDIIIPSSARTIQRLAFARCSQLKSVFILNGTEKIDCYAFESCSKLSKVYLPASVREIADEAFPHRKALKFICPEGSYAESYAKKFGISYSNDTPKELPDIKKLKEEFMKNHPINLDLPLDESTNPNSSNEDIQHASTQTSKHDSDNQSSQSEITLFPNLSLEEADIAWDYVACNGELGIGYTITKYKSSDENVVVPGSINGRAVCGIGERAFSHNNTIKTLLLPPTISFICDDAFNMCKLEKINLPDSITYLGRNSFWWCINLTSVTLPAKIDRIYEGTFSTCIRLGSITIPASVKVIEPNAFSGCSNLESVVFEGDQVDIRESAFHGCNRLSDQDGFVIINGILFDFFGSAEATVINGFEYHQIKPIDRLIIPSAVKTIGKDAFYNVRDKVKEAELPSGLKKLSDGTFRWFSLLTSFDLPSSLTEIAPETFFHCQSLEVIQIPGNIWLIGDKAFSECAKLKQVTICEGVKEISYGVFTHCPKLKEVYIPESVRKIGKGAFSHSSKVKLFVVKGSFAESYAVKYGIPYIIQST